MITEEATVQFHGLRLSIPLTEPTDSGRVVLRSDGSIVLEVNTGLRERVRKYARDLDVTSRHNGLSFFWSLTLFGTLLLFNEQRHLALLAYFSATLYALFVAQVRAQARGIASVFEAPLTINRIAYLGEMEPRNELTLVVTTSSRSNLVLYMPATGYDAEDARTLSTTWRRIRKSCH